MVAELGYQLDGAWSQLKPKFLRTPVMDFLDWILRAGKTLNLGHTFYGGSPHRHTWKKEAFGFCLFVFILSFKFIYPVASVFLSWCYCNRFLDLNTTDSTLRVPFRPCTQHYLPKSVQRPSSSKFTDLGQSLNTLTLLLASVFMILANCSCYLKYVNPECDFCY